jgi:hypothetical protein
MSDIQNVNEVGWDPAPLDLDRVFTEDSAPVGVEDVAFGCQRPHWEVSRSEFKQVLQVIQSFPSRSAIFLALWRSGSKLCIHANNRDAFIDSELPLLNSDEAFDSGGRVYFLDSEKLLAFVNAYRQFVFSFDEVGAIFYESPYSLYRLDTLSLALNEVRVVAENVSDRWKLFPLTKAEVGVFKALYGFAVKLSDSKVLMDAGKVDAFFTLYKYSIFVETGLEEKVVLRRLDLPAIHEAADGDFWYAFTPSRLYFKFSLGVLSFLRVPYDTDSFMYPETFAAGRVVGKFRLDVLLVRNALRLSALLNADVVTFRQDEGSVSMVAGNAKFKVGTGAVHEEFLLDAELFTRILTTVDVGEVCVDVVATEQGMDLILNRDIKAVYSLSRTSVAQLKRDEKAAMRLDVREERVAKRAAAGTLPDLISLPPDKSLAQVFQDIEVF